MSIPRFLVYLSSLLMATPGLLFANDLSVETMSAPDPVYENGIITYSITIKNNGTTTATNVSLVNTLSNAVTYLSHTTSVGTCTELSGTLTCDSFSLAPSMSQTIDISASTGTAQTITNLAEVTATEADPNVANNSSNHQTEVKSTGEFVVGAIDGGSVHRFSYDPNNSNTLYAGTIGAGVFKSVDDGRNWSPIFLPTLSGHFVNYVLPSAETANLLLVCAGAPSGAAIWRSTDGGLNFDNVLGVQAGACQHIAEGNAANTYYAAVENKVYKSTDSGLTWTTLSGSISTAFFVTNIVQLPSNRLVISLQDAGMGGFTGFANLGDIFYSDDDGSSWTEVTSVDFTESILSLTYNGANKGTSNLQATVSSGPNLVIWSSSDGANWVQAASYTLGNVFKNMLVYSKMSDSYFLLSENLYQSGAGPSYTWPATPVNMLASSPSYFYLGTTSPRALAVDPDDSNTIVMGFSGGDGIIRTDDGAANWVLSNAGYNAASITIATKDRGTGYRYAANREAFVYFAESSLGSWKTIFRPDATSGGLTSVTYDQSAPSKAYIAFENGKLMVNTDVINNGEDVAPYNHLNWNEIAYTPPDPTAVPRALWADGSTLFMGFSLRDNPSSGNYLYKSIDSGVNWNPVTTLSTVGGVRSIIAHPTDKNIMYAGSGDDATTSFYSPSVNANGIFKSIDSGATWARLDSDIVLATRPVKRIVLDPNDSNRVWLLAYPPDSFAEVWESLDGGASWANITPLNVGHDYTIAYISTDDVLLATVAPAVQNISVSQLHPGTCSAPCTWSNAFGVYGEPQALYNGSVGVGTGAGLYEFANVPAIPTGGGGGGGGGVVNPADIVLLALAFFFLVYCGRFFYGYKRKS